jgi:hypothetical protein
MENESRQRKSSKNEVLTSQKAMDLLMKKFLKELEEENDEEVDVTGLRGS